MSGAIIGLLQKPYRYKITIPLLLQSFLQKGTVAQLVEQRTENPCVAGSIPAGTTGKPLLFARAFFYVGMQNNMWLKELVCIVVRSR